MDKAKLEILKKKLLHMRSSILNGSLIKASDDLKVSSEDLPDEADVATNMVSQQVSFNIRERELHKLRLIESALERIEDGSYGHCAECEEEITFKRLDNQPWAELCIVHAEEKERENSKFLSNYSRG